MNELNPQAHTVSHSSGEISTSLENQDNHEASILANDHTQVDDLEHEFGLMAQRLVNENEPRKAMEQLEGSMDAQAVSEQEHPSTVLEQADSVTLVPQLPEEALRNQLAMNQTSNHPTMCFGDSQELRLSQTQDHGPIPSTNNHEADNSVLSLPTSDITGCASVGVASPPIDAADTQLPLDYPKSLRGNPYMLAASLTATSQDTSNILADANDSDEALTSQGAATYQERELQPLSCRHESLHESTNVVNSHCHSPQLKSQRWSDDEEYQCSIDDEFSGESDCSDDDEEDESEGNDQTANVKPYVQREAAKAKSFWEHRHELFQDDGLVFLIPSQDHSGGQFKARSEVKHESDFEEHGASNRNQQRSSCGFDSRIFGAPSVSTLYKRTDQAPRMPNESSLGLMNVATAATALPDLYQGAPQTLLQYAAPEQHTLDYQNYSHSPQPYAQAPPHPGYVQYPIAPYDVHLPRYVPPSSSKNWLQEVRIMPDQCDMQRKEVPNTSAVEEYDSTDDDEPLRTRVQRHPSVFSNSVIDSLPPHSQAVECQQEQGEGKESDVESDGSNPKPKPKNTAARKTPSKQRVPAHPTSSTLPSRGESVSSNTDINWALPKYDASYEPGKTKHDPGVAKISLPGLIREELFLSPDHAEQEIHLLLHIFMPAQKELPRPEPAPAQAILNFHTIAVMVIEAYVQYEIGDEFGTGRGHWHNDYDKDDGEYERLRDAKDADPDEIFFAVIDRWRAGLESNKQPLKLIRGVQEFCDVALDVIYYIKDHGLLKQKQKQRAVRSDKGVKRGARKGDAENGKGKGGVSAEKKGVKRGAGKINELQAKKKPKIEKPKIAKPKAKRKQTGKRTSRAMTPDLTVIKAPSRKK